MGTIFELVDRVPIEGRLASYIERFDVSEEDTWR